MELHRRAAPADFGDGVEQLRAAGTLEQVTGLLRRCLGVGGSTSHPVKKNNHRAARSRFSAASLQ